MPSDRVSIVPGNFLKLAARIVEVDPAETDTDVQRLLKLVKLLALERPELLAEALEQDFRVPLSRTFEVFGGGGGGDGRIKSRLTKVVRATAADVIGKVDHLWVDRKFWSKSSTNKTNL